MKMVYSGKDSAPFWRQVGLIKNPELRSAAYNLGCALQSIEWQTIKLIEAAVTKRKPRASR